MSYIVELFSKLTIKSPPLDPAPSVLTQLIPMLLPVITLIVNQSLCSAVVLNYFKLALLNLKNPFLDVEGFANFRPISK